jgi:hypothetical protein
VQAESGKIKSGRCAHDAKNKASKKQAEKGSRHVARRRLRSKARRLATGANGNSIGVALRYKKKGYTRVDK